MRRIKILLKSFIFLIIVFQEGKIWAQTGPDTTKAEPPPELSAKVYNKVAPAMVNILCDNSNKNGSGAIVGVTDKGHAIILTACHVVATNYEEAKDLGVPLRFHNDIKVRVASDSSFVRAIVLPKFYEQTRDLTLIATTRPMSDVNIICYNLTKGVRPGKVVAALGFPETFAITQTVGRITRIEGGFLIFDAVIAPGSSGGPLVDKHGRMIGVSRFIYESESYAVAVDTVLSTVTAWLDSLNLKKQWKRQQFANLGEHLYKDKLFIAGEALTGVAAYIIFGVIKPFEEPILPGPPTLDKK